MSDDEFIDPSSEVKTLDEMPQFEDEQTSQPSTPPPNATVEDTVSSSQTTESENSPEQVVEDRSATESPPQDIAPAALFHETLNRWCWVFLKTIRILLQVQSSN